MTERQDKVDEALLHMEIATDHLGFALKRLRIWAAGILIAIVLALIGVTGTLYNTVHESNVRAYDRCVSERVFESRLHTNFSSGITVWSNEVIKQLFPNEADKARIKKVIDQATVKAQKELIANLPVVVCVRP